MKANSFVWTLSSVRSKWDGFRIAQLSVVGIFALIMGLPVLFLMVSSFNVAPPGSSAVYGLQNWTRAFSDTSTLNALWMSFVLSAVRLIPATILAVVVAWLIARTDIPGGGLIEFLCWFAYFVPDFPLTLAWILLLDPNFGFLNSLLRTLHFSDGSIFNPYGFWGIVWVHLATDGIWFKVMLLTPIFRRLGASLEEASHIAGADMATTLRRITLPLLSPIIL